jgi:hypothetical protein
MRVLSSTIKKNEILPIEAIWIELELESIILTEVSQTKKDRHCMMSALFMCNLKH